MSTKRTKRGAFVALSAGILLAVTACGSPDNPAPASSASTDTDDPGLIAAQESVDTYGDVIEGALPTEPLSDGGSLAGKKIVYIPAVAAIPFFATSFTGLQAAFETVGMTVELCDGQANPANVAACLDQALNGGAAGVIMDALPPAIAQTSFDAVVAAGLPVVLGNIPVPDGSPDTVQRVGPDTALATAVAANAIIADSGGAANILAVKVIDSPATIAWMDDGALVEIPANCPSCAVTVVETKTADLQNLPPKVSAAILADSGINYLLPELSPEIVPAIQGATDAGRTDIPAASIATTLGDLQMLAAGDPLFATVGWDVVRTGWLEADMMMRLVLGDPVDSSQYELPVRLFTEGNVGDLDLTQAGWDSSDWFGGPGYQETLTALWQ